jgi:hypothetical protein
MATGPFGFARVLRGSNGRAVLDKTAHTVLIDLLRKHPEPPK